MQILHNNTTTVEFNDGTVGTIEAHENKVRMFANMFSGLSYNMEEYRATFSPKIYLIKLVRSEMPCSLRTAKMFVEECANW